MKPPIEVVAYWLGRHSLAAAQERGEIPADAYNPATWLARDTMAYLVFRAEHRQTYPDHTEADFRQWWRDESEERREVLRKSTDALCDYLFQVYQFVDGNPFPQQE